MRGQNERFAYKIRGFRCKPFKQKLQGQTLDIIGLFISDLSSYLEFCLILRKNFFRADVSKWENSIDAPPGTKQIEVRFSKGGNVSMLRDDGHGITKKGLPL